MKKEPLKENISIQFYETKFFQMSCFWLFDLIYTVPNLRFKMLL